ncbi:MAG: 3-dehydroquinate synthase [Actinomycetaceae bacterium]|nr:3-dehydroquinate synthase [Actinomycetaceae bacterium]
MSIVLVGLPGAGKTTVGRLLAQKLGTSFADSDEEVVKTSGTSINEIFANSGEMAFRHMEASAISRAFAEDVGVLSVGGGALTTAKVRHQLAGKTVVFLDISPELAYERVGGDRGRPLLQRGGLEKMRQLAAARRPHYLESATFTVQVAAQGAEELVAQICAHLPTAMVVEGPKPYQVLIGTKLNAFLPTAIGRQVRKVLIIHPPTLRAVALEIRHVCQTDAEVFTFETPDGEAQKTIEILQQIWRQLGQERFSRTDLIVGLGGGATTDLAGFAAATWLRGIAWLALPTTLLAMVDAAIGGKTAINSEFGKNLIGSFYPPRKVIADTAHLTTLPQAEITAGIAEAAKCGFVADPQILSLLEAADWEKHLRQVIEASARVKVGIVSADLEEKGVREILNYGHTLAHALEKESNYHMRHGHAVAVGMVFAAHVANDLGLIGAANLQRHYRLLTHLGLPTTAHGKWQNLFHHMQVDKKNREGKIRMVLLQGIGDTTVQVVPEDVLARSAGKVGLTV